MNCADCGGETAITGMYDGIKVFCTKCSEEYRLTEQRKRGGEMKKVFIGQNDVALLSKILVNKLSIATIYGNVEEIASINRVLHNLENAVDIHANNELDEHKKGLVTGLQDLFDAKSLDSGQTDTILDTIMLLGGNANW